jgi:hypothetical protein
MLEVNLLYNLSLDRVNGFFFFFLTCPSMFEVNLLYNLSLDRANGFFFFTCPCMFEVNLLYNLSLDRVNGFFFFFFFFLTCPHKRHVKKKKNPLTYIQTSVI